jgi:CBS domain containing-hemolysin-like protein
LAALQVAEAFEPEAPLVLAAELPAKKALLQLVEAHGHCLVVADGAWVVGLVTLADLQRALSAEREFNDDGSSPVPTLLSCRRSDLVWLPMSAQLAQLEDQLRPNGLRQLPVFDVPAAAAAALPHGLPNPGLPVASLRGLASRDGMARALARQLTPPGDGAQD